MQLDPRTHVIILLVATLLLVFSGESWHLHILVGLSALYMLSHGLLKKACYYALAYIVLLTLLLFVAAHAAGFGLIVYTFS